MIADFVRILRAADIRVSPAETLDAAEIFETPALMIAIFPKHAGPDIGQNRNGKAAFDEAFEAYCLPEETPPPMASRKKG